MKEAIFDIIVFLVLAVVYTLEAIVLAFVPAKYRTKSVRGDIVLVTGGGGGLGRLLCERFSKLGATIVAWDINQKALDETVALIKARGGVAHGYICDITNRDEVYKVAQAVKKDVGRVSILINNAGFVSGRTFLETPDHLIERTFQVNSISHFWTTKAFLPDMLEAGHGHLVTIASMAGFVGMTKLVDYCASKFACIGFDEGLRLELESMGNNKVNMTVVCPYFLKGTGMFDGVSTRFIPILEASDVADRVVKAVQTNEKRVYLPSYYRELLILKSFFPWSVGSMFLRTLVLDAHPDTIHKKNNNVLFNESSNLTSSVKRETATENLQSTLRSTDTSERKP